MTWRGLIYIEILVFEYDLALTTPFKAKPTYGINVSTTRCTYSLFVAILTVGRVSLDIIRTSCIARHLPNPSNTG